MHRNRITQLLNDDDAPVRSRTRYKVSSSLEERLYATTDANHNVTSIDDVFGAAQERLVYDPYRQSTVLSAAWASTADLLAWSTRSQGEREDATTNTIDGRSRLYGIGMGRWMQADFAGYIDGANRYQFELSMPTKLDDPSGKDAVYPPNGGRVYNHSTKDVLIEGDWVEMTDATGINRFPTSQQEEDYFRSIPGMGKRRDPWAVETLPPGANSRQYRNGVALIPGHFILDVDFILENPTGNPQTYRSGFTKTSWRFRELGGPKEFYLTQLGYKRAYKLWDIEYVYVHDCPGDPNKLYIDGNP